MPAKIELDFARRQPRLSLSGAIVLLFGCAAAYWTFSDYRNSMLQAELLQMSLVRYGQTGSATDRTEDAEELARITAATRPLATPWSALLHDLEVATQDSGEDIALLAVAPDRVKRQVRISAEARSLPAALDYVKRLQGASTLLYPMLEKHEVQTADREHPVRFEISAQWSISQ